MAKNFPYFKFTAHEWLTGDIVFEDFELQGLFINVCAIYWHRDGKVSYEELSKRLKTDRLNELTDRFFSVIDGFISVKFLDEQLIEAKHISKVNSDNGKKGGRPKANTAQEKKPTAFISVSESKAKKSKEEEEQEEEVNKNKNKEDSNTRDLSFYGNFETVSKNITEDEIFLTEAAHLLNTTIETVKEFSEKKLLEMKATGAISRYSVSAIRGFILKDFKQQKEKEPKFKENSAPAMLEQLQRIRRKNGQL